MDGIHPIGPLAKVRAWCTVLRNSGEQFVAFSLDDARNEYMRAYRIGVTWMFSVGVEWGWVDGAEAE